MCVRKLLTITEGNEEKVDLNLMSRLVCSVLVAGKANMYHVCFADVRISLGQSLENLQIEQDDIDGLLFLQPSSDRISATFGMFPNRYLIFE